MDASSQPAEKPAVQPRPGVGKVFLVGAGPGDPGLITVRGVECLAQADLVLYDGLVNPLLLRHSHARATRTCRMTGPSGRRLDQAEINRQLVEAGLAGLTVVRLKGGDPFVFGRGTEEAAALAEAGVPFEVVPGITAATAAAVYAGLSLTHRDHASAVALMTGHEDPAKLETALDYGALVRFPGTLVFYMGLHRLPQIAARLIAAGKSATTPAAVVSRATTPLQRTITAPLGDLPERVAAAGLHAPSLVIVGDCVGLRSQVAWFEDRPLFGQTVAIARPEEQADETIDQLLKAGAQPLVMPTIAIAPPEAWSAVDAVLARMEEFDWLVFTSVNGVTGLWGRVWECGRDARVFGRCRLAAIGPSTARALERYGLRCDLLPDVYRAEALAEALAPLVSGRRVLWVRGSRGRDVLPMRLRSAGAVWEEVVVYRNRDVEALEPAITAAFEQGTVDWLCLSSPSIARSVASLLSPAARAHVGEKTQVCAISPVTAEAAREVGLPVNLIAAEHTWPGMITAMGNVAARAAAPPE